MTKVFISYRRQPSAMLAQLIPCKLGDRTLDFFLDTISLEVGPFPEQLVKNIQSSDVFVCLLAKTTLESPYVRDEITHAVAARKMLIPVFQEGFDVSAAPADEAIRTLLNHNGLPILDGSNQLVDQSLHLLRQRIGEAVGEKPADKPIRRTKLGPYRVLKIHPPVAVPPKGDDSLRGTVQVLLAGNINTFDSNTFKGAVAGMLGIRTESITILKVQPGSIHVTLELPWQSAMQFYYLSLGQWPELTADFANNRRQPCPTCRRLRWFIGGALAVLLVTLAVWFYQTGIPISSLFPEVPQAADVQVTATRTRTPTRTPSPTRTPTPTRTPRRSQPSGQSVPALSASNTPTLTNTPSVTPTDTVPPPPPPTVPPMTSFAAWYSPSDFFVDSGSGRLLVPDGTVVTFYATDYSNICGVMWDIWYEGTFLDNVTLTTAPFTYTLNFVGVGNYDVGHYPYTCDPGNPSYGGGVFYFVVPTG